MARHNRKNNSKKVQKQVKSQIAVHHDDWIKKAFQAIDLIGKDVQRLIAEMHDQLNIRAEYPIKTIITDRKDHATPTMKFYDKQKYYYYHLRFWKNAVKCKETITGEKCNFINDFDCRLAQPN